MQNQTDRLRTFSACTQRVAGMMSSRLWRDALYWLLGTGGIFYQSVIPYGGKGKMVLWQNSVAASDLCVLPMCLAAKRWCILIMIIFKDSDSLIILNKEVNNFFVFSIHLYYVSTPSKRAYVNTLFFKS